MKTVLVVLAAVMLVGCATGPVIGPFSAMTAQRNEQKLGAGEGGGGFSGAQLLSCIGDVGLYGALFLGGKALAERDDSGPDRGMIINTTGDRNSLHINTGDGSTVSMDHDMDNSRGE